MNENVSTPSMKKYITQRKQKHRWLIGLKFQWLWYNIEHPHSIFYNDSLEDVEGLKSFSIKHVGLW